MGFEQEALSTLRGKPLRLRTLSLRPVIFQVDGFILPSESQHVIELGGKRNMFDSEGVLVTADKLSKRAHNDHRTSTQAWLSGHDSKVIADLDERTSNLTRVDASHNEEVQLLKYGEGQFYHAHLDWGDLTLYNGQKDQWRRVHYGWNDRLATLFWYLNDVEKGGETVFPKQGNPVCPVNHRGTRAGCKGDRTPSPKRCDVGLRVSPKGGSVILWYNYHPDGTGDQNSLHGGCPPAAGLDKWSGNKWINTKPFGSPPAQWMPSHPALKRFGWDFGADLDEEPNGCQLSLRSEHAQDAMVAWINPDSREGSDVSKLDALGYAALNSYQGHEFEVRSTKRKPSHSSALGRKANMC